MISRQYGLLIGPDLKEHLFDSKEAEFRAVRFRDPLASPIDLVLVPFCDSGWTLHQTGFEDTWLPWRAHAQDTRIGFLDPDDVG